MSTFLFYSDLHLRPERLADCELVLSEIHEHAKKLRDKFGEVAIINGGDTFNTRGVIKTSCFDVLQHHYRAWHSDGFKQIILVGNHDQEDREGDIHPMRVFEEIASVVDTPTSFPDLDLMCFPYMAKSRVEEAVQKAPRASYAVAHWGIAGAMRNAGNIDTDGVPVEWLKKYKKVFCGHYHHRNNFANVQYIGSPMQQNFGEMGQDKGVLVFHPKKNRIEFVELTTPPKHHEVQIHFDGDKEEILKPDNIRRKDFVRTRIYGDAERCASIDQAYVNKRIACDNIKIEREVTDRTHSRMEISNEEVLSPHALAEKYVGFVPTELDKKKLLKIGKELMGL